MPNRVRVILALNGAYPDGMRFEIGEALESSGWVPAGDNHDCWICRAAEDQLDSVERRVRKIIEFGAFTAGMEGRLGFALKIGGDSTKMCAVRIGSGGMKTKPVQPKSRGLDFATKNVPGGSTYIPGDTNCPGVSQLKTAF